MTDFEKMMFEYLNTMDDETLRKTQDNCRQMLSMIEEVQGERALDSYLASHPNA